MAKDKPDAALDSRTAPQSPTAEDALLGCLILDEHDTIRSSVLSELPKAAFYRKGARVVYETISDLHTHGEVVDLVTLRNALADGGHLKRTDNDGPVSVDDLLALVKSVPSPAGALSYAKTVHKLWKAREVISVAAKLTDAAYAGKVDEVAKIVDGELLAIFTDVDPKHTTLKDCLPEALDAALSPKDDQWGYKTGYYELDDLMGGLKRGEVTIIAARPSMGKSALAVNIAEHLATKDNVPVAIFSLEMTAQSLAQRMLYGRAEVNTSQIKLGTLRPADKHRLQKTTEELSETPIIIDLTSDLTPMKI